MQAALEDVTAMQHPPRCSPRTAIMMRFENRGAAATLNYIAGLLGVAHMQVRGRTPAFDALGYACVRARTNARSSTRACMHRHHGGMVWCHRRGVYTFSVSLILCVQLVSQGGLHASARTQCEQCLCSMRSVCVTWS